MRMKQEEEKKFKKDKTLGKRKQITDMTQREKRHQRNIWRVQKRKLKERRQAEQERILTPPSSPVTPEHQQGSNRQKKQLIECKFNKTVQTANNKKTTENDSSYKQTQERKRRQQEQESIVPEKRQIDDKQMNPYDRKKNSKHTCKNWQSVEHFVSCRLNASRSMIKLVNLPLTHMSKTSKQYAQYSEMFIPNEREMTNENIKSIYRKEILSITKDKSFMGIWQVHALSSVLKTPIQSVYPELGNRNVRKDMHKLIKPVSGTDNVDIKQG
ncbi:hypothetical protein MAR_010871 [Mya arenaria]|uniref:Uncharacterized protein n=1 Tax=Mya arenaria TaxID=6604 RepID=A0ABY7FVU0_MYAAR|nr:hypothetical protein MAR_010871 [Mya arenaria]